MPSSFKKKNISIFIYSLAPGGAERVVSLLLQAFHRHYHVTLVLMNDTLFYDVPDNVKVVYLEKSNPDENGLLKLIKLPWLGWRYKRLCKQESIDISLAFLYRPNYITLLAKLLGARCRNIVNIRSTTSRYKDEGLSGKINLFLIRRLFNRADLIVSNSQGVEDDLKSIMPITTQTKVIYNPIDLDMIRRKKDHCDDIAFDFHQEKKYIISVGRLIPLKRNKDLIDAFYDLQKNDASLELIFVGDGVLRKELEEYCQKLSIQEKVHFLGNVGNPFYYLAKSNLFVLTSETEGFPNVLVEAMACGLPVIASDCKSGPREILEDGKYGLLFPVGDVEILRKHMHYYLYDKDVDLERIRQMHLDRLKDFTVDKIMKEFESIL